MAGNNVPTNVVIRINDRDVVNSFSGISNEVKKLERELRGTIRGTEEWTNKFKEVEEAKKHLEKVRQEIGYTKKTIDEVAGSSISLKTIFTGNVAADFFTNATQTALEFGKALKERISELIKIQTTLSQLDEKLKGAALLKASASVKAISETYGKGVEEIQLAVKGLNAQTKDTNKSLDLIKKGFEAGADASGEMLTQLKEYPTMMNDARVSAEEMIAIMANSEKMGVYDDKGIDAIKEGMIRLREGTKATTDAMTALGIDTEEVYAKIKAGTMTYFDVIKMVSNKLKEVGADSRITGTAIADIFGGPGEDASYEFLSSLGKINTNLQQLTDTTNENIIAKKKELESNEKLNSIWVQLTGAGSSLSVVYSSIKSGLADMLSFIFKVKEAKLSDEYLRQQNRLIYLKGQLDANNISENNRLSIIKKLKSEFPEYFANLSSEEKSHLKIAAAINKTIDALGKKYKAQVMQEGLEKDALDFQDKYRQATSLEMAAQQKIESIYAKRKKDLDDIGFKFKSSTAANQLKELQVVLEKMDGTFSRFKSKDGDGLADMEMKLRMANKASINAEKSMRQLQQTRLAFMKKNGLTDDSSTSPTNNSTTGSNKDANLNASPTKYKKDTSAADTAKALEARKKDLEESLKAEAEANNRSLEAEIQFRIDKEKLKADSYEKERNLADLERAKEFQAQKKQCDDIIATIEDLEKKKAEAKSPEAAKNYEDALKKQRELLDTHDQIVLISEETHQLKLKTIKEKWDAKTFEESARKSQREIDTKRRTREQEITDISSLDEAKAQLIAQNDLKLTDQELRAIDNLEDAKAALREAADRAMLKQQEKAIQLQIEQLTAALNDPALSEESRKQLEENLDFLKDKITQIRSAINQGENQDQKSVVDEQNAAKENVDILGFSAKDWEDTFSNIDDLQGALKATAMVFQALGNAGQMFSQLQQALNERELRQFNKIQDAKKKSLLKNLNEGYITREEYVKETEKLEAEAANKKAEMEYKQAKAEKISKIFSVIGSTAAGVAAALPNIALAAIVGSIGAIQLGIVASQPLPEKPKFAKGGFFEGFTGASNYPVDETGERPFADVRLHEKEWVAPRWMTEHPRTAKVIDYLESVRQGKTKPMADGGYSSVVQKQPAEASDNTNNDLQIQYIAVMQDVRKLLQKLDDEGIESYMVDSEQNGKLYKKAIKKFETIENRAAAK